MDTPIKRVLEAMQSAGLKYDVDKPPVELLDRHAMEEIARVMGFGAKKYARHNWRKGIQMSRLMGAAMRHITAYNDGESVDPESGLSHLAHAGCCVMFALWMEKNRPDMDDRRGVAEARNLNESRETAPHTG